MQTVEGLRIQSSERRAVGFRCGFHSAFKGSIPWRRVPLKGSIRVTIRDLKGTIIMQGPLGSGVQLGVKGGFRV